MNGGHRHPLGLDDDLRIRARVVFVPILRQVLLAMSPINQGDTDTTVIVKAR